MKNNIGKVLIILTTAVMVAACQNTSTTADPVPRDLDRTDNDDTTRVLVEQQQVDTTRVAPDSVNHK